MTTNGARKVQLDLAADIDNLQSFHFNIPLRGYDLYGCTQSSSLLSRVNEITLLDTARPAVLKTSMLSDQCHNTLWPHFVASLWT